MARTKLKKTGPLRRLPYARCSDDEMGEGEFTTLDVQEKVIREALKDTGDIVLDPVRDDGYTGTNLNRPGWRNILRMAEKGEIDIVDITFLSRLGRGDAGTVAEWRLKELGVQVVTHKEKFTDDRAGFVNKTMTRFVDGMYVENVREWTKTKMDAMFDDGYVTGHHAFGYEKQFISKGTSVGKDGKIKMSPQVLIVHPENGEIITRAFGILLEKRRVAIVRDYLNSVTTKKWTTTNTKRLLSDERYLGIAIRGAQRKEGAFPALVDRGTWEAAQEILAERAATVERTSASTDYTYYLHRLVHCAHCGCPFTNVPAKGGKAHYYECYKYNKRLSDCPVQRINADSLHAAVLRELNRAVDHHTVMHRIISNSGNWGRAPQPLKYQRKHLLAKKNEVTKKIKGATEAIIGGMWYQSIQDELERLEGEKAEVVAALAQVEADIAVGTTRRPTVDQVQGTWSQITTAWFKATENERRWLIQRLVKRVEVTAKDRASLQLTSIIETPGSEFVPEVQVGAGVGLEPTTFGLCIPLQLSLPEKPVCGLDFLFILT